MPWPDVDPQLFDPDPYPELGMHKIRFAVQANPGPSNGALINAAAGYTRPPEVTSTAGDQPLRWGFLDLESNSVILAALKAPEDGEKDALILRLYEAEGKSTPTPLRFALPVRSAIWVDIHEQAGEDCGPIQVAGRSFTITLPPYRLGTLRVKFAAK